MIDERDVIKPYTKDTFVQRFGQEIAPAERLGRCGHVRRRLVQQSSAPERIRRLLICGTDAIVQKFTEVKVSPIQARRRFLVDRRRMWRVTKNLRGKTRDSSLLRPQKADGKGKN